jgi:hypothetical protein
MNSDEREDSTIRKVVVRHKEQYSIWFADRRPHWDGEKLAKPVRRPSVWPTSRKSGPTWRPLTLRKKMDRLFHSSMVIDDHLIPICKRRHLFKLPRLTRPACAGDEKNGTPRHAGASTPSLSSQSKMTQAFVLPTSPSSFLHQI